MKSECKKFSFTSHVYTAVRNNTRRQLNKIACSFICFKGNKKRFVVLNNKCHFITSLKIPVLRWNRYGKNKQIICILTFHYRIPIIKIFSLYKSLTFHNKVISTGSKWRQRLSGSRCHLAQGSTGNQEVKMFKFWKSICWKWEHTKPQHRENNYSRADLYRHKISGIASRSTFKAMSRAEERKEEDPPCPYCVRYFL